jgi:Tfp pilus assembly protein PilO
MNIENKTIKTYSYALILGFFTIVGAIIIYFLIISPLYASTQKSGNELETKEKKYTELTDKKNKLDELKDKEDELKQQASIVSNALPKEEEIGRLFIQLDGLAKLSNGTLKSVTKSAGNVTSDTAELGNTGINKTVYSLPLDLPTYFDLKTFIAESRSALRLFSINDFNITSSSAGALTVNLTANSYTRN